MTTGRRPKPSSLKLLAGNPGKRPLPKREPKPGGGCPSPPSCLSKEGRAEWQRMANQLYRLGVLTQIDRALFASYCEAWALFHRATKRLREEGDLLTTTNGNVIQHPAVGMQNTARESIRKIASEFGLSPSARGRVFEWPDDGGTTSRKSLPFDT